MTRARFAPLIAGLAALAATTSCGSCTSGGASSNPDAASTARTDGIDANGDTDASPDASLATAPPDAAPDPAAVLARGKSLYARYCNFCHGEAGKGYAADQAPALASDDLLTLASDDFLRDAVVKGRPGTTMSAWSFARRGPLSHEDATAIVAYIRTWQKRPNESTEGRTVNGTAANGAAAYAAHCASCHGAAGTGGKHNALANAELLAAATDGFLATTIERGRAATPMPAFKDKLTKQNVDDIVALLRSWQKPPEDVPELPPKAGALVSIVLNPRGPQPPFDAKADFVKVDDVKKEYDRKATMIIIDARPPADYARMHVAGAINVPFYEVEPYSAQIPKDRYILTYCGCPHAESGKARDALRKLGYTRAAIMDEGLYAWRDRGYPVRGGPKP
jgi:cytochrome c oxidase cbb3-type subunit 3/ubiquinol-cytochrome c reductase cytochrome c subunit